MTITLAPEKLAEIMDLVGSWLHKVTANIQELRSLLGKLLYMAQCCPRARLFTNRMLETLRSSPLQWLITLSDEFRKDLAWFHWYLCCTDGMFQIHEEFRTPIPLYGDTCTSCCGVVTTTQAYNMEFPPDILKQQLPICHLEALNAVVALKIWAPIFTKQFIHLFSDNTTAMAIFQAGRAGMHSSKHVPERSLAHLCNLGHHLIKRNTSKVPHYWILLIHSLASAPAVSSKSGCAAANDPHFTYIIYFCLWAHLSCLTTGYPSILSWHYSKLPATGLPPTSTSVSFIISP